MYTYRVLSEFCKLILKLSYYFTFLKRFKNSRFFSTCVVVKYKILPSLANVIKVYLIIEYIYSPLNLNTRITF